MAPDALLIPAATYRCFVRGKWVDRPLAEPFWIESRPVSWRELDRFLITGGMAAEANWPTAADYEAVESADAWYDALFARATARRGGRSAPTSIDDAVTAMTWNDAAAVARHSGARLPTEFEWEIAAQECGWSSTPAEEWTGELFFTHRAVPPSGGTGYVWEPNARTYDHLTVRGGTDDGDEDGFLTKRHGEARSAWSAERTFRRVWTTEPAVDALRGLVADADRGGR